MLVLDILVKSAVGLRHLHYLGIAHRDFRRDNVLVYSVFPLNVKVTDFGLAHIQQGGASINFTATVVGPVGACWIKTVVSVARSSPQQHSLE